MGCPEKLWMLHCWKCSTWGWMGLWATWYSGSGREIGTNGLYGLFQLIHSMIKNKQTNQPNTTKKPHTKKPQTKPKPYLGRKKKSFCFILSLNDPSCFCEQGSVCFTSIVKKNRCQKGSYNIMMLFCTFASYSSQHCFAYYRQ